MAEKMISYKFSKKPDEMNALTLAYMGDAVFELYVRKHIVAQGGKPNILHRKSIAYVSAQAQAKIIRYILPSLSTKEAEIVKRGRNAKSYTVPKNTNVIDYRYSTAFEALIGYLYLTNDIERLEQIIEIVISYIERNQNSGKNG